jgi:antibiotic biosynthesis monooxygenase (ABM) superfamily enzyme
MANKTETKEVEYNINQKVKVKLTPLGYYHLAEEHNHYVGRVPGFERRDWKYYQEKADENGFTEFQFWNFMNLFGGVTSMGKPQYFCLTVLLNFDS